MENLNFPDRRTIAISKHRKWAVGKPNRRPSYPTPGKRAACNLPISEYAKAMAEIRSPSVRIHQLAAVDDDAEIGEGTVVWQYSVVLARAVIGRDCNLNAHTFVEGGARIGDRVTLKSGVYVWDGITLEDDVFCGPNATFTNDRAPRSKVRPAAFLQTRICKGASIGAGAVILPGLTVGEGAMIGAGSVVTRDVPPNETWVGNPARRLDR